MKSAIEFMKTFQAWRRGADIPQPSPAAIGEALDQLILAAEQYLRDFERERSNTSNSLTHNERFNVWWESRERNEFIGVSRHDAKRIWLSALDDNGLLK